MRTFLQLFWYLGAIATLANARLYRSVFNRRISDGDLAAKATAAFRRMALWQAGILVSLGAMQTLSGSVTPLFPFLSPFAGSWLVGASWIVAVTGMIGFGLYLRSLESRVAGEIGGALFAGTLSGPLAVRTLQILSIAVPIVLLLVSTLSTPR